MCCPPVSLNSCSTPFGVESIVLGVDVQEEAVIGRPIETGVGEHRVAEAGQSVEGPHPEKGTERGKQHRQLKGDRHERRAAR